MNHIESEIEIKQLGLVSLCRPFSELLLLLKVYSNDFPHVVIARSQIHRQISLFAMHNTIQHILHSVIKRTDFGIRKVKTLAIAM